MDCPRCGKPNDDREYRFCVYCGNPLPNLQDGATLILPDKAPLNPLQARPACDFTGQIIEGNYRLDRMFPGGDEFSAVYQATRLKLGDEIAVKLIRPTIAIDDFFRDRFQTLAQTAARLKHPAAVAIHDFGITPEGLMFLVMELAEGHRLSDLVAPGSTLEPMVVAGITNQICAVLDHAEQLRMVHGELSPQKIIVKTTPSGVVVKVLGFGQAEIRDLARGVRPTNELPVENIRYYSPEQCMGHELDARSDVYSLGLVVFELLSGARPFDAASMITVLSQKLTQMPPSMGGVSSKVTPAMQAVVGAALAREREARPGSARLFAQQLNQAVYGPSGGPANDYLSGSTPLSVATEVRSAPTPVQYAPVPSAGVLTPAANFATGSARSGQQTNPMVETKRRSKLPFVLGGVALIGLVGVVLAAVFLLPSLMGSSNGNKAPNKNQPNGSPSPTPTATPEASAEAEFNSLRERLLNATPAQRAEVRDELVAAEARHPEDYRFPYLRAKLLIDTGREHHEAFTALYDAGKKAIANDRADAMTADLQRDGATSFSRLTDHQEWTKLLTALQDKNADLLKLGTHLH